MKCIRNSFASRLPAVALVLIATLAFTASCAKKEAEEIRIGAILPLTGDGAKYGEEAKNGIELALEEYKNASVKVLYEDDQGTSSGAVDAFNKIVEVGKAPIIIGPMYSSTALAIAPLAERRAVVVISPSASSPDLTDAGEFFFRNWPSDVFEGGEIAKYAYDSLGLMDITILAVNLQYGVGLTEVFTEVFQSLGGKILAIEYYDDGMTDFRTHLSKVKSLKPEALYLPGYYAEIGLILRQAKELGLRTTFLSCVGFNNPKVLEIAGTAANGVVFARPYYDPEVKDPMVQQFVERFTKRYDITPGVYAAHAYDAMRLILEAIEKGGYSSRGIKIALADIKDFPGVTGNTSFDANGDVIKPIQVMRVDNGTFKSIN